MVNKEIIAERYQLIQDSICAGLEALDGKAKFKEDVWERPGGGGGRSRIVEGGRILEKGGVNFSAVHGPLPEAIQKSFGVEESDFFATGVSIVLHPVNPWVPIIHMNIRYFELNEEVRWFGGGIDLTPHYIDPADARLFHQGLKSICDGYHTDFYPKFKDWADTYFYIPHRQETRGIGGIFYDKLNAEKAGIPLEELFHFSEALGHAFVPLYKEQVERNVDKTVSDQNKAWQLLRRGRYVEFNLVYDAGTRFGLQTQGRIESILMSLPAQAGWTYDFQPEPGSEEARTLDFLKSQQSWL